MVLRAVLSLALLALVGKILYLIIDKTKGYLLLKVSCSLMLYTRCASFVPTVLQRDVFSMKSVSFPKQIKTTDTEIQVLNISETRYFA